MKPKEAMEILSFMKRSKTVPIHPHERKALQLGIEGLEYYQKVQADLFFGKPLPLHGETED